MTFVAYSFDPGDIGLTYSKGVSLIAYAFVFKPWKVSPFVGALLAALLCGPLTDFAARRMSVMNKGSLLHI